MVGGLDKNLRYVGGKIEVEAVEVGKSLDRDDARSRKLKA